MSSISPLKDFRHRIENFFVALIIWILSFCPLRWISWTARRFGDLAFTAMPKRRRIALENLDKAFGSSKSPEEKKNIARASFQHMTLALIELFLVSRVVKHQEKHFKLVGGENLQAARDKGKGILFIISHIGSWEYLSFVHFLTGINCYAVVKDIRNPYLDKTVNDCRRKIGLTPVQKKSSSRKMFSVLRENQLVAILMDQWSGPEGLWLPFFGHETSTTSIAPRLAKKTGAAMVPGRCVRVGEWQYEIQLDPEIPLAEGENWETETTLALSRHLENQISRYPEQWTWGHKRWKQRPVTKGNRELQDSAGG